MPESKENNSPDSENSNQNEPKTYTQEELNELLNSESAKRTEEALENFKKKELPKLLNKAKTEAEKLAALTAEEKENLARSEYEARLKEREAEITKKELRLEASRILNEKELPGELADVLNYSDAESLKASMAAAEKAFKKAVENEVNKKLKGSPPLTGAGAGGDWQSRLAEARKNRNQLEVIRIKREAAENGVSLM
jgi:hypothetical protein